VDEGKTLGRPRIAPEVEKHIELALAEPGRPGIREIARQFGVAVNTVLRINTPPFEHDAAGL
jgi:hypothetical protein